MCTVLLPPGVNPIAVNKNISYNTSHIVTTSFRALWRVGSTAVQSVEYFWFSLDTTIFNYMRIIYSLLNIKFDRLFLKCINLINLNEVPMGRTYAEGLREHEAEEDIWCSCGRRRRGREKRPWKTAQWGRSWDVLCAKYYEDKIKNDDEGERDMYGREEKLMENFVWKALRKGTTWKDLDEYEILLQYTVEVSYNVIRAPGRILCRYNRGTWRYGKQWRIGTTEYLTVRTRYRVNRRC